ncbi:MAG: DsrE family protein [Nitrospirae bacterium]|nr:DsrE family protein [Nitrospirota bacterium]
MNKVVYIITNDPKERLELVSSILAQALTALSFNYEAEIFVMDNAVRLVQTGYADGLKAPTFEPLMELVRNYQELGGRLYACFPSADARHLKKEDFIDAVDDYVNAVQLLESSKNATAVFTY